MESPSPLRHAVHFLVGLPAPGRQLAQHRAFCVSIIYGASISVLSCNSSAPEPLSKRRQRQKTAKLNHHRDFPPTAASVSARCSSCTSGVPCLASPRLTPSASLPSHTSTMPSRMSLHGASFPATTPPLAHPVCLPVLLPFLSRCRHLHRLVDADRPLPPLRALLFTPLLPTK